MGKSTSTWQQRVYDTFRNTDKHIVISATAGSGKTTTLLELLNFVPKFKRAIFLSFSTGIVKELVDRVPKGIQARTLHSLGYSLILKRYGDLAKKVEENKYFLKCLKTFYSKQGEERSKDDYRNCFRVQDICSFVRMTLTPQTFEDIKTVCEHYNVDYTDDLIEKSIDLLGQKEDFHHGIDYVDMLYLPLVIEGLIDIKFDNIFLDEAQDLNECQFQFVMKLLANKGKLVSVGDENQCIYSFMGSSIENFNKLKAIPNTEVLTLPVSYRCPKKVVQLASSKSDLIREWDEAEEGVLRYGEISEVQEGDIIVSRNTRPLVHVYFQLLEEGKKAVIVGKEIEKGLVNLAERCTATSLTGLLFNFEKEMKLVKDELIVLGVRNLGEHYRVIDLGEKIAVLTLIAKQCDSVSELVQRVKQIFVSDKKAIKLMTIHKSKGLENERIFMIMKFEGVNLLPSKYAIKPWELEQEDNLEFVGYTRAKRELILVNLL